MCAPPEVNVGWTTTASNTWLFRYLLVDSTLGTLQALVHIVSVNRKNKFAKSQMFNMVKIFYF